MIDNTNNKNTLPPVGNYLTNPFTQQDTQKPADVSPRVHELMQRLDRLPPGIYQLEIVKPEVRAVDWKYDIAEIKPIERGVISKTYKAE